jgi:tRNA U38,U39,U40 pseudouridine synthase TruA
MALPSLALSDASAPTIQSRRRNPVAAYRHRSKVSLSGRTDAVDHALGHVVSSNNHLLPVRAFVDGLYHHLPQDIVVRSPGWPRRL